MTSSNPKRTFKQSLQDIINRADDLPQLVNIDEELARISERVRDTLDEISRSAEASDSPDDDARVVKKLERTMEILDDEMLQLAALYHRSGDVRKIRRFVDAQRDLIRASIYSENIDSFAHAETLDGRITQLHNLMASERKRIRVTKGIERRNFWIGISIAMLSLIISAYSLLR